MILLTVSYARPASWTLWEIHVGICSACLPMCRPIVKLFLAKVKSFRQRSSSARELESRENHRLSLPPNRRDRGFVRLDDDSFRPVGVANVNRPEAAQ